MPTCLDLGQERVERDIVDSIMENANLEPCDAVYNGYSDSFAEAIELILGADYISCHTIYLFPALAIKQVQDLVETLNAAQLFTILALNTELVARVKTIVAPANFKAQYWVKRLQAGPVFEQLVKSTLHEGQVLILGRLLVSKNQTAAWINGDVDFANLDLACRSTAACPPEEPGIPMLHRGEEIMK